MNCVVTNYRRGTSEWPLLSLKEALSSSHSGNFLQVLDDTCFFGAVTAPPFLSCWICLGNS